MIAIDSLDRLDRIAHVVMPALWRSSWQAAVLAGAVIMVQFALGQRLAPRWRHAMWWVVLLRLVIPVTPPSPFSLFNVAPQHPAGAAAVVDRGYIIITQTLPTPLASSRAAQEHRTLLIIAAIWTIGVLWMLSRIGWASAMLALAVRRMIPVRDKKVLALLDRCRDELGVRRKLVVLTSPISGAPALMGFLRPRLLLPPTVLQHFDAGELRLILLHELAHLKRHDVAINWLASILQAVHWFNPMVHVAFARLRNDRELAADELVLSLSADDEQRLHYGETLVKLLQTLSRRPALSGTVGILERAHPMRRRITMIAQFHRNAPRWTIAAAVCLLVLAALGLTDRARGVEPAAASGASTQPTRNITLNTNFTGNTNITTTGSAKTTTTGPAETPASFSVSVDDQKLMNALSKRLPEVRFDAIGFSDVIDFLRDVTGANITVNWRALESAGIDKNAPCSTRLKDVSFEQALTHILREIGGGTVKLAYAVSDGSVVVSTEEELSSRMQLRTYVVSDLLQDQDKGSAAALENLIKQQVDQSNTPMVVTAYHDRLLIKGTPLQLREVDAVLAELRKKP